MSYTLTLEVPEDVYFPLSKTAEQTGLTPEEMAARWLIDAARQIERSEPGEINGAVDDGCGSCKMPQPELRKQL